MQQRRYIRPQGARVDKLAGGEPFEVGRACGGDSVHDGYDVRGRTADVDEKDIFMRDADKTGGRRPVRRRKEPVVPRIGIKLSVAAIETCRGIHSFYRAGYLRDPFFFRGKTVCQLACYGDTQLVDGARFKRIQRAL